ncbi:hypothetical protein H6F61_03660 [Cyanobacteria bacterium FACHB-472]|nr:hypothetical protein [Cyanobacteria bacterium FACHB-472]
MPLLLLSCFFSHSGQPKNCVGRSLGLSRSRSRVKERSHPLHKTRSRSRVKERSHTLKQGSPLYSCWF